MAITTSKVTYSLKPETVDRVQELATLWGVPKSEVIRRAVDQLEPPGKEEKKACTPLEALEWFRTNGISAEAAAKWNAEVLRERRAWGRKRR
ncbi:MAG: ribbon-helix-helix protein, CopG family [Methylacidiphilales bacterium]|nr:ribbon-helix-helix protein, CopG family [Candidatus Methylacidiphilales bacterium]